MKALYNLTIACCSFAILVCSCKKDIAPSAVTNTLSSSESLFAADEAQSQTIYLQPGPDDGQDAFVSKRDGDVRVANSNFNSYAELSIQSWIKNGQPVLSRSYIKFPGLAAAIPAGATIVSAKLRLYGLAPNTSQSTPQGNSVYPGSPYSNYPDNSCYVLRVVGHDWNEDSITWNNKPGVSTVKGDTIPSSTSQWNYNATADVTTLVKKMVGAAGNNYGFCILLKDESPYRSLVFASSEATDENRRPVLAIRYKP